MVKSECKNLLGYIRSELVEIYPDLIFSVGNINKTPALFIHNDLMTINHKLSRLSVTIDDNLCLNIADGITLRDSVSLYRENFMNKIISAICRKFVSHH